MQRGDTTYWRCSLFKNYCDATSVTVGDHLKSETGSHNHTAEPAELEKRRRINVLKESGKNTTDVPSQIIATATINMPKAVACIFPSIMQLTRTIQRTRRIEACAPLNPSTLADLIIPPRYTKILQNDDFLLFDSGPSADRILLYSTTENLTTLSQCYNWYEKF